MNVLATTVQTERPSSTKAPIGLHTRNVFLHDKIQQNMVALNMNFGYQVLTDLLKARHGYSISTGISEERVLKLFQF